MTKGITVGSIPIPYEAPASEGGLGVQGFWLQMGWAVPGLGISSVLGFEASDLRFEV